MCLSELLHVFSTLLLPSALFQHTIIKMSHPLNQMSTFRINLKNLHVLYIILFLFISICPSATTDATQRKKGNPSFRSAHPVYLIQGLSGGVGNQLFYICESLMFARHGNMTFIPPTIHFRHLPGQNPKIHLPSKPYDTYLDSRPLSRIVTVAHSLPEHCGGQVQHIFITSRSKPTVHPTSPLKNAARYLIGQKPGESLLSCARRFKGNAKLHNRFFPLSSTANFSFVEEVSSLKSSCVFLEGHSMFQKGLRSHEYLYSFMHYVQSAPSIKKIADQWNVHNTCVLHLRYDETQCLPDVKEIKDRICVRRSRMARKGGSTVVWVSESHFVNSVVEFMRRKRLESLYLAMSPYVPDDTQAKIRSFLSNHVKLAVPVPEKLGHTLKNFVERELAVRAKEFIGDFGSTWSGTIYYKRRTQGRRTEWSCAILEKCHNLGFYKYQTKLETPGWFEKRYFPRPLLKGK